VLPGQWVMKPDPYSRTSRFERHLGARGWACDSAVRGYMAAGASRPAGGFVVLAPDGRGAALYLRPGSAQG
jgi:hypothetical protein